MRHGPAGGRSSIRTAFAAILAILRNAIKPYTALVALLLPLVVPCIKYAILWGSPLFPTPSWAALHVEVICCALAFDVWAIATVFAGRYVAGGGVWQTTDQSMVYPKMPAFRGVVDVREGLVTFGVFVWHLLLLSVAAGIVPSGPDLPGWSVSPMVFAAIVILSLMLSYGPCLCMVARRPR